MAKVKSGSTKNDSVKKHSADDSFVFHGDTVSVVGTAAKSQESKFVDTRFRFQKVHCVVDIEHGAVLDSNLTGSRGTVAQPGKVKSQCRESGCCELTCDVDVNSKRTYAMDDTGVQNQCDRSVINANVFVGRGQDSKEAIIGTKVANGFFHFAASEVVCSRESTPNRSSLANMSSIFLTVCRIASGRR